YVELGERRIVLGADELRLRREQLLNHFIPFHGMPDYPQISLSFQQLRCYPPGCNDHALSSHFASPALAHNPPYGATVYASNSTHAGCGRYTEPPSHRTDYLHGSAFAGFWIAPDRKKNARSWVAMYRVRGKFVMETLGAVALIPKVEVARQRARDSMLKARAGTNPVAERRERER